MSPDRNAMPDDAEAFRRMQDDLIDSYDGYIIDAIYDAWRW